MSDWLRNPAKNDEERRLIRLTRYAVREELWLLLGVACAAAGVVLWLLHLFY